MMHEDAPARRDASRRRTWLTGGILLLASALLTLGSPVVGPDIPIAKLGELCLVAALVLFAVGIGRDGSVTARRPLGTSALIALAVWILASPVLLWVALERQLGPDASPDLGIVALMGVLSTTVYVVSLMLALIAVTQIAWRRIVPAPWNWAPLWALAAIVAARLPTMIPFIAFADQGVLTALSGIVVLLENGALCFLGVVAIMLSGRPVGGQPAPDRIVPVYPSPQA